MLVLSYGIPKSGSTLGFEFARATCEAGGFRQVSLPADLRSRDVNMIKVLSHENVARLIDFVEGPAPLVVKVHTVMDDDVWDQMDSEIRRGRLKVHAIYRDPREICLSLMDAGEQARDKGLKGFSKVQSMADAETKVVKRLDQFRRWAALTDALILRYDALAFDSVATVQRMGAHLGIALTDQKAASIVADVTKNRFTQKNKAVAKRYLTDMSAGDIARTTALFGEFIDRAIETEDMAFLRGHPVGARRTVRA
jgi:hypothetical protein